MDQQFEALVQACTGARHWLDAADNLKRSVTDIADTRQAELIALEYVLSVDEGSDQMRRWGPFGPMLELEGGVIPIPLSEVTDDVLARWVRITDEVTLPLVQSRLQDLLWERRIARPDMHCRSAIDAYLDLGTGIWQGDHSGYEALTRALQLSLHISDEARISSSIRALLRFAQTNFDGGRHGLAALASEVLADLAAPRRPTTELTQILESGISRGVLTADLSERIFGMLGKLAEDTETRANWHRRLVQAWLDEANHSTGLARVHALNRAAATAGNLGISDLEAIARGKLQGLTDDDLGLAPISADIQIPTEDFDNFVNQFIRNDNWQSALTRLGAYPSPVGDRVQNEEEVRKLMQESPLQFLVTKVILNELNLPIAIVSTPEQHFDVAMKRREALSIGLWGVFVGRILEGIKGQYNQPTRDELASFFTTDLIPTPIADRVARAFELWWEGQPDESAHVLLPRIEAIIRNLAQRLGIVVYIQPHGHDPGRVQLLGSLLGDLSGRMDESRRRYLANLLTDELGHNLRNMVLHGMIPSVQRADAGLLLDAVCYLRLLEVRAAAAQE